MTRTDTAIETANCWIELSRTALRQNVAIYKRLLGPNRKMMSVIKANAYGHGMLPVAHMVIDAGADWLGVFSVAEGTRLRHAGISVPILVLGPLWPGEADAAAEGCLSITAASLEALSTMAVSRHLPPLKVHLKLESGTHRQGLLLSEVDVAVQRLQRHGAIIEGAYTHFADIEDTTDHTFAGIQMDRFCTSLERATQAAGHIPFPHAACTAAAILFPHTWFKMARVGIGVYGLWPSRETRVSAHSEGRDNLDLQPVMTWKTRIAQIKPVNTGEGVGYGRTWRATRDSRIAILPIGYADGYDRSLSNGATSLVRGRRARVAGRICMNLTMVDVTDIPDAAVGDEVVVLGRSRTEAISAEDLATIAGTINYEIVTRAAPGAPRIVVD